VNPVFAANPVTFTANVTSANAAPTGTVSFVDGQTQLASVSLAQGTATYTTSNLALGGHTITAVYSGDVNYVSLPSSPVTETVEDFSVSVSIPAGQSTSPPVLPGGTLNFNIQVVPTLSATFPSAVSFSASGLPGGATAKFAPATLAAGTTSNAFWQEVAPGERKGGTFRRADASLDGRNFRRSRPYSLRRWGQRLFRATTEELFGDCYRDVRSSVAHHHRQLHRGVKGEIQKCEQRI